MPNVDNKSISCTRYSLGRGFDGGTERHYTVTKLQLRGTGIKMASAYMLGQESQRHIRESCITGKGSEKEDTKNRIRKKG